MDDRFCHCELFLNVCVFRSVRLCFGHVLLLFYFYGGVFALGCGWILDCFVGVIAGKGRGG